MQTYEIPSDQWGPFFDKVTRNHVGEPVTIEVQGADVGARPQATNMILVGVTFDTKDSTGQEVDVMVRNGASAHLMHAIQHPSHVRIAQTDDGKDSAIQVESADGPTMLVRFNMPPEMQDLHHGRRREARRLRRERDLRKGRDGPLS